MNKIKELRLKKKLTLEKVSDYMGITPKAVGEIEKRNLPSVKNLVKISPFLHCNWWEIITDQDKQEYKEIPFPKWELFNVIKEIREKLDVKPSDVYMELGILQSDYARLENNKKMIPRIDKLSKISNILGCNIQDLIVISNIDVCRTNEIMNVWNNLIEKAKNNLDIGEAEFCAAMGFALQILEKHKQDANELRIIKHSIVNQSSKDKVQIKLKRLLKPYVADIDSKHGNLVSAIISYVFLFQSDVDKFTNLEKEMLVFGYTQKNLKEN